MVTSNCNRECFLECLDLYRLLFELGGDGIDPVDFDTVAAGDPAREVKDVEFVDEEAPCDIVDDALAPGEAVVFGEAGREMERVF